MTPTRVLAATALFLSTAAIAAPAGATSFDCSTVGTEAEYTICGSRRLSHLDDRLARSYAALQARVRHPILAQEVVLEERDLLAARNACRADVECLSRAYSRQIDRLESWTETRGKAILRLISTKSY